jgi:hypothetical protein
MKTKKITESEIKDLKIASLPTRPTAPSAFGGRGYTAEDMKAAFDKLPLIAIARLNSLIEDVAASDGIVADIPTGIREGHTLLQLFTDIASGAFAEYLTVGERSLADAISEIEARLDAMEERQ